MTKTLSEVLASRRWRRSDAELVFKALAASGMSKPTFARRHGLHIERLRRWERRLRRGVAGEPPGAPRPPAGISLVPVKVRGQVCLDEPTSCPPLSRVVTILDVSIGGARVHVPADFDPDHLRRVVAVLAGAC